MFGTMKRWKTIQVYIFWVAFIGVLASIVLAFSAGGIAAPFDAKRPIKVAQAIVLCIWVFAPPLWFWYEYYFVYARIPEQVEGRPKLDNYKHGVDVASKLWLALVTVLLGLYFGKDFSRDPGTAQPPCVVQQSPPATNSH